MSLPFTRRIARAALLVAAGAAPIVGAAGSANAVELPTSDLSGIANLDGAGVGKSLDHASQSTTDKAGTTGGHAVRSTLPKAGTTVDGVGTKAAPATARKAAGQAEGLLGDTAHKATKGSASGHLPTDAVRGGGLPTGSLPGGGHLPTGQIR